MLAYLAPYRQKLVPLCAYFALYLGVALLNGWLYRELGTAPSSVLPPAGIALAAFILEGYLIWPAIALGALANGLLSDTPSILTLGSILGNTLMPLAGYYALRKMGFSRKLGKLSDMFALIMVALVLSALGPAVSFLSISLNNYLFDLARPIAFYSWWLGSALSMLILTPFLIRWVKRTMTPRSRDQLIEIGGVMILVGIVSVYLFATPYTSVFGVSLILVQIVLLFWLAFRAGPRFMTLTLFLMTMISLAGALWGTYEPAEGGLSQRIFNTQIYDLFVAAFFFVLVSLEEQRKNAISMLNQRNLNLQKSVEDVSTESKAKNEFIATLAHELRNPLAPLMSSVEILKLDPTVPDEAKKTLESMREGIATMGYLLDDLLDISRITERKLVLKMAPVALERMVRKAVDMTMPQMTQFKHSLTVTLPADPVEIVVDSLRLEQVMVNLLHNSAKYTPVGGQVDLLTDYADGVLTIVVRDTGIGISPSLMDRIFEPFVQIHDPSIRRGGIGIGLSLTKNLVEMHGGTIDVAAGVDGVGTEFTIRVPAPLAEGSVAPVPTTQPDVEIQGLSILVVDDNIGAAESLTKLLGMRGHRVHAVYDGIGAVSHASINRPDVVILDIGLPDISGYDVAERLRAAGVTSTLIALTGYGLNEDKVKATAAGFDHHLVKPVGLSNLEPVLAESAKKRKQKAT